ncbi:MAG TPA: TonB-dependent siderophore receptor [Pyrinomonadaceae bacterium]|jgi:catecholate siderophore receptor
MFKGKFKVRKKQKGKTAKRKPRFWLLSVTAVGFLVAYTVGESRALNVAHVKDNRAAAAAKSDEKEENPTLSFNIPAGPLAEALAAFEKITGLRVILTNDTYGGLPSKGVSGDFTSERALIQILDGTGLTYSFTAQKTVTLRLLGPNETVQIVSEANSVTSPKYTQPLREIPQSITIINKQAIDEQGATTLRDVLQNVPGLTITAGEGGAPAGDNLTLRGFSARNDIFIDGVRDLSPQSRDPFNIEQVEVAKGPTSAVSGRGSTGGTINLISKVPTLSPFYNFDVVFGTDKTKRVTGDINVPLSKVGWGDRTSFRLNLMAHDSNFAGREVVENNRWGVAPTFSFGLGSKSFVTVGYFHLQQNNLSDYGIPWVPATNNVLTAFRDRPAPVPRETFYGFLDRDREKLRSDLATVQFTHTFDDNFSLRNQLRYSNSSRDSIATPPRFANNNSTLINREMRSWIADDEVWDNQTDFTAKFNTGLVKHSVVTGAAFTREGNIRKLRTAPNSQTALLNPNPNDVYTGIITSYPDHIGDITADSQAFYFFDTLNFGDKFDLTGGFRWDRFDAEGVAAAANQNTLVATLTPIARVDKLFSFRVGAVYKPVSNGSIYASVASSLNPSLEGLSIAPASASLDPEKTYNYELGTKWDLFRNRILLSGAIFRVDKTNARTPEIDGTLTVLDGRQRVNGIELGVTGIIRRGWSVLAGYTLLDSRIVKSNANPVNGVSQELGKRLVNTPRNSLSLWSTYQTPWRLTLGGGTRFIGKRYGNTINTRFVESYWLVDAMASYRVNKNIDLRINAYNLTNEYYFDRIGGGHLVPGAGRSALFGIGLNF